MLQIDFSTSLICSIEKGIVKRQLLFSDVKNCHEATGTRFSISFRGRSDYELEAASLEDKQKVRTSGLNHSLWQIIKHTSNQLSF